MKGKDAAGEKYAKLRCFTKTIQLFNKRKAPAQLEEGESSLRDRLEKTDPEFVEFLKSEDPTIFEEFAQVKDDIPALSEEASDETESEEEPQSEDEQVGIPCVVGCIFEGDAVRLKVRTNLKVRLAMFLRKVCC